MFSESSCLSFTSNKVFYVSHEIVLKSEKVYKCFVQDCILLDPYWYHFKISTTLPAFESSKVEAHTMRHIRKSRSYILGVFLIIFFYKSHLSLKKVKKREWHRRLVPWNFVYVLVRMRFSWQSNINNYV